MAKFYGEIGYIKTVVENGDWIEDTVERPYYGDLTRNPNVNFQSSGEVNDNINISNSISILADSFANENLQYMRYVKIQGTKWKITSAEIQYPRIILSIGGVYNG